jgi:hypothetical protein
VVESGEAVRHQVDRLIVKRLAPAPISMAHAALMVLVLAVGLAIDVHVDLPGQVLLSAAVWLTLFYVLPHVDRAERQALFACLAIATAGELFLSLVWGLYTYRLENIPMFVPPGHAMLLLLGMKLARNMSSQTADAILAAAAVYAFAAAITGFDTFAIPLIAGIAIVSFALPSHRPLYASTFLIALALELYGTWLGNWAWSREVPVLALVTTNPPGVASAFYAVLDALVLCTGLAVARRASRFCEAAG